MDVGERDSLAAEAVAGAAFKGACLVRSLTLCPSPSCGDCCHWRRRWWCLLPIEIKRKWAVQTMSTREKQTIAVNCHYECKSASGDFSAYGLSSLCYFLQSFTWELVSVPSDAWQATSENGSLVSSCSIGHCGLLDASPLPSNGGGNISDILADSWVHQICNRQWFLYGWSRLVSSSVLPCRFVQDLVIF